MTLALYRKYRPGTFAEVIGQEHVTGPIMQAIRNGKVNHAYLFSGPRGCGKTSSARILARSLNCEQGPTPEPCGVCDSCVSLAPNGPGSLDVIEIDAASHGGVDDARDLRERAFYAPVSSRFKIYIIDEAHMVTREGFNALLKLVEEPPPHLKFVFATTEPEKVIGTIRSRTHHYPFRLVPPRELLGHLSSICDSEGVPVDPLVLPLVVRAGAGSVRDALSVLDQLLAGAGAEGLTYTRAVGLLGYTDAELLAEVVDALAARDGAAVFLAVDRVVESGHDPRRFAADLLERLRDLLILQAVPDAAEKGLLDVPSDQLERMESQATALGAAELSRCGDILAAGLTEMRGATAPRLLLELVCARLLLPAAAVGEASVLARLDRLERRMDIGAAPLVERTLAVPAASAAPSDAERPARVERTVTERPAPVERPVVERPAPEPVVAAPVPVAGPGGAVDAAAVRRVWPQVMDTVKGRRRTVHALLLDAQVLDVSGETLRLSFTVDALARRFSDTINTDVLAAALRDVLGVQWRIQAVSGAAAADPTPTPANAGAGAAASPTPYDGFAPGDQPLDETPAPDDAPSGEDAAVALLREGLGAKVIGELDAG